MTARKIFVSTPLVRVLYNCSTAKRWRLNSSTQDQRLAFVVVAKNSETKKVNDF